MNTDATTGTDNDLDVRTHLDPEWVRAYEHWLPRARCWWEDNQSTKSTHGVEQTTVRSYPTGAPGKVDGPVAIFNRWAAQQTSELVSTPRIWQELQTRDGYACHHSRMASSLASHWKASVAAITRTKDGKVCADLTVGQKYKLLDLYVRHLWITGRDVNLGPDAQFAHAHLPLDRKSLHVLSATYSGLLISPKFSMGMIARESQYRWCQGLVRKVCGEVGGTPLLFDVFAWHSQTAQTLYS